MIKKLLFIPLLFIALNAHGAINEKYSYKDFMHQSFVDVPASEFNNSTIVGSCFYQESIGEEEVVKDIFPDGLVNVIFEKCNLDNVLIKSGMSLGEKNSNRKIKVQNDWDDWILDDNLKPVEPMDKVRRIKAGKSIDPKDIPKDKWTKEEKETDEKDIDSIIAP